MLFGEAQTETEIVMLLAGGGMTLILILIGWGKTRK